MSLCILELVIFDFASVMLHLDHLLKYFVTLDSFPEYLETNIRTQNTENFHEKTCPGSHDFHVASLCLFVFFFWANQWCLVLAQVGILKDGHADINASSYHRPCAALSPGVAGGFLFGVFDRYPSC